MFTTGSKLLIGSALASAVFAAVYGITQGGTLGTIGLVSAAVGLGLLAAINAFVRDANVSAMDHEAFANAAGAQATARRSLWPLLMGLGVTTVTLGLVTTRAFFMVGMIAIFASAVEWMIQGWSEKASADPAYNARARDVMVDPVELPVAAAAGAGVVVYSFSRIMLGLPTKTSTVMAFAAAAILVLAVAAFVGYRKVSKPTLTGAFSIVAVALVAGGSFAGLNGERETHAHETAVDLAAEGNCGAEETEADEHASQTVAAQSNVVAEVLFDGSSLHADVVGFDGDFTELTLARSNPSNLIFRNESSGHARLVLELHPDEEAEEPGPEQVCTALVEPGGAQLMTVRLGRSSLALTAGGGENYALVVPGSDASLEVIVP
ncbi:MAG TPA: hypothetical protein VMM60_00370 [Ilumatobacter sp.]|nr:hypothetical protein [Ilumatobacter sp.]